MQSPKVLVKMDLLRKLFISAHHLSQGLYTRLLHCTPTILHGLAARLLEMTFLVYNAVGIQLCRTGHHFQIKLCRIGVRKDASSMLQMS